jgi:hypothetical protein
MFERSCPVCGKVIIHKDHRKRDSAIARNTSCRSCSKKGVNHIAREIWRDKAKQFALDFLNGPNYPSDLPSGSMAYPISPCGYSIVDTEDWYRIYDLGRMWSCCKKGYAYTQLKRDGRLAQHRFIMSVTEKSTQVDHIEHNKLDNRKSKLRCVTNTQNQWNRTKRDKSIGVYLSTPGVYQSVINADSQSMYLGSFPSYELAGRAYDNAGRGLRGEFFTPNYPDDPWPLLSIEEFRSRYGRSRQFDFSRAQEMIAMRDAGKSYQEIGECYGVSRNNVGSTIHYYSKASHKD